MGFYLSAGVGPVRYAHRIGGRRRRNTRHIPFYAVLWPVLLIQALCKLARACYRDLKANPGTGWFPGLWPDIRADR